MNYMPLYEEGNFRNYRGLDIFTEKEIEVISGIRLIRKRKVADAVACIIKEIDRGAPVMVPVDCFYLTYREDTYKKKHLMHFLLAYGYDKKEKQFTINEHCYLNSSLYRERDMDFVDLKAAYDNFLKRLDKTDGVGIIKFQKTGKEKHGFSSVHYMRAYKDNKERIKESIGALIKYCDYIIGLLADKRMLDLEITKIIEDFGYIRFKKQIQKYQMAALFGDEKIDGLNYRSMDDLVFVCGVLAKIRLAGAYNEKSVEKLTARLREIKQIETKIHGMWLEKCDETFC
jgi:hypothetical protein